MTLENKSSPALELRGIVKKFGPVIANDRVDLSIQPGEIRALVGENGAGKTTLMKVAYGEYRPDAGEILVGGLAQRFSSPLEAISVGLGMVHQHFMLFPHLSVLENVVYGAEPNRFGVIDRDLAAGKIAELSQQNGLEVDPSARVEELSVGARQRVEILKALYRQARILILDEPTAVLGPAERDGLFRVLESLAAQGTAVVFITHKLPEVARLAERASVMRDGKLVGTVVVAGSSPEEISRMMVGRDLPPPPSRSSTAAGAPSLVVKSLSVDSLSIESSHGRRVVESVSLDVHAGEIVGVAGAAGNGQNELIEALMGIRPALQGEVLLAGQSLTALPVAGRRAAGLSWLPDDRDGLGMALDASITDNLMMGSEDRAPLSKKGRLHRQSCDQFSKNRISEYEIKAAGANEPAHNLSGGNRQKVTIAREFPLAQKVLLAEQPTRGLDLRSTTEIHRRLLDLRADGCGILLVSSELSEILALSDRILVMFEGRVVGAVEASEATEERLGLLMAGSAAAEFSG